MIWRRSFLLCYVLLITSSSVFSDDIDDNNRPYEFSFNIVDFQHRHEKKDKDGLVTGEYGFITADGVYHETGYATDKDGDFIITKMRNRKITSLKDAREIFKDQPEAAEKLVKAIVQACGHCKLTVKEDQTTTTGFPRPKASTTETPVQKKIVPVLKGMMKVLVENAKSDNKFPPTTVKPYTLQRSTIPMPPSRVPNRIESKEQMSTRIEPKNPIPNRIEPRNPVTNSIEPKNPVPIRIEPKTPVPIGIEPKNQVPNRIGLNSQVPNRIVPKNQVPTRIEPNTLVPKRIEPNTPVPNRIETKSQVPNRIEPKDQVEGILKKMVNTAKESLQKNSVDGERKGKALIDDRVLERMANDIYYRFNYTITTHDHQEEGYRSGSKDGSYRTQSENGVDTQVKYLSNEFGHQPNITFVQRPIANEEPHALKGYSFKWYWS